MKISIITVCRNAEQHIEKAIQSIVSQTYSNLEYIIIDGDSQDNTKAIINPYHGSISRFISEPDSGIYNAMNKGLRFATGDYIGFINADDYLIDEHAIEDVAHFLAVHPDCDFVYGDLEVRYPSGKTILGKSQPPENMFDEMICGCLPHQASFARADLFFSRVGLFNENNRISSDYEWFLRLVYNETVKLCHYPRTIASYYAGGLSSRIELAVPESYKIQNQFSLYQQPYWIKRRLLKFQKYVVQLRQWLAATETSRDTLQAKYDDLLVKHQNLLAQCETLSAELAKLRRQRSIEDLVVKHQNLLAQCEALATELTHLR
ncbi:MAG: glycosyltransferase [Cyanothece sp. SIO2G6]|nr:glycosyltransferase [Cyanothece sp. SIO2G6]